MNENATIDNPYKKYEPLFGSWYITDRLGKGTAGQLYRIRRTDELGNEFSAALKVISVPAGGENEIRSVLAGGVREEDLQSYYEGIISDISSEFTILERLKGSSHIVDYQDHEIIPHGDSLGWDILIRMELITPLLDYVKDRELSPDEVLGMGADLCRGLSLCARNNIIHRDIKPENIFVTDAGGFKLGDFGVARIDTATRSSLSRKGTFPYMAPEVFRGEEYDQTIDVYSLGLVMYQYLNHGRLPFLPPWPEPVVYEDTEQAFAERVTDHPMPSPAEGSPELKAIVLKACAYHPEDRYQTAEEMLLDLEELQREGKLKDLPKTGVAAAKRQKARRRRILTAVLAALIILGAILFFAIPRHVTGIEGIEQNTAMVLDESLTPEYEITPARFRDEPITFTSSNEDVFTVSKGGTITAVGVGDGVLTIQAETYTREVQISVAPKVTAITGVGSSLSLTAGQTKTLKPKLSPKEYADEPITYRSDNREVFTVSDKGVIKAVGAGSARLTISAGGYTHTVDVKVKAAANSTPATSTPGTTNPAPSNPAPSTPGTTTTDDSNGDGEFDSSEDEYF